MYISGSLINRTIRKNSDLITNFNQEKINFGDFDLFYTGQLEFLNYENNIVNRTVTRQEALIMELYKHTLTKLQCLHLAQNIIDDVANMIKSILKSYRKITYASLELLDYIVLNSNNLLADLKEFQKFYNYLITIDDIIDQTDLNIMIYQFKHNLNYQYENLAQAKQDIYHLNLDDFDYEMQTIIKFGELVNPNRLMRLASTIQNNPEFAQAIAPLYFLIKDAKTASTFLYLNRNQDLNLNLIKRNAQKCKLSSANLKLIKK